MAKELPKENIKVVNTAGEKCSANSLKKRYLDIHNKVTRINNYDIETFTRSLEQLVDDLGFFYNVVARKAKSFEEASKVKYDLPKKATPKIGQVAYFNIGRGYPKELFDGHWCYVVKDFGNEMIVIPTTSIKANKNIDSTKELEIKIKDFEESGSSRLRINQMKCVDIMRIHKDKKIYDVETSISDINKRILEIFDLNIDN